MALIKCHECGNDVSTNAKTCPKCGATPKTKSNIAKAIIGAVVAIVGVWFLVGGGVEKQVANDAEKEYEIAKQSGTAMDICVHAGLVSAAYLQAKDDVNYQKWKKIEKADCRKAGLPD